MKKSLQVHRGDLYYADLSPIVGSEQGGVRPVVIIQNDIGNRFSPTTIVVPITSQQNKSKLPTHVSIAGDRYGLPKRSIILAEQIRTLDKKRFKEKIGKIEESFMNQVDRAIQISLALTDD